MTASAATPASGIRTPPVDHAHALSGDQRMGSLRATGQPGCRRPVFGHCALGSRRSHSAQSSARRFHVTRACSRVESTSGRPGPPDSRWVIDVGPCRATMLQAAVAMRHVGADAPDVAPFAQELQAPHGFPSVSTRAHTSTHIPIRSFPIRFLLTGSHAYEVACNPLVMSDERWFDLGIEAMRAQRFDVAADLFERCEREPGAASWLVGIAKGNRGICFRFLGRNQEAITLLCEAHDLLAATPEHVLAQLRFRRHAADALAEQRRVGDAASEYKEILATLDELSAGNPEHAQLIACEKADTLSSFGSLHLRRDDFKTAESILRHGRDICPQEHRQALVSICINLSHAQRSLGMNREAIATLEAAREAADGLHDQAELARIEGILGNWKFKDGDSVMGEMLLRSAIERSDNLKEHAARVTRRAQLAENLGQVQRLEEASTQIHEAEEISTSIDSPRALIYLHTVGAITAQVNDDTEEALRHMRAARTILQRALDAEHDPERRILLALEALPIFRPLSRFLGTAGLIDEAFYTDEYIRGVAFRARLSASTQRAVTATTLDELCSWVVSRAVHRKTAVIVITHITNTADRIDQYGVLYVAPTGNRSFNIYSIPGREVKSALAQFAESWPDTAGKSNGLALEASIAELQRVFADPWSRTVTGADHVILVPPGDLWALPWATMLQSIAAASIVPSATWITQQPVRPRVISALDVRVAGFGYAGDIDLAHEAELVAHTAQAVDAALREYATPVKILKMLRESGVVHLSAHGEFEQHQPAHSRILLSDGDLHVHEIIDAGLKSSLVVASLCYSARVHSSPTDDVIGIAPALLAGGAQNAIGVLWAVPAAETPKFVCAVFEILKSEAARSVAEVVVMARQRLRKILSIETWGAFEVYGTD